MSLPGEAVSRYVCVYVRWHLVRKTETDQTDQNSQPVLPVSRAARVLLPRRPGLAYLRYLSLVAEKTSHRMVRREHGKKDI